MKNRPLLNDSLDGVTDKVDWAIPTKFRCTPSPLLVTLCDNISSATVPPKEPRLSSPPATPFSLSAQPLGQIQLGAVRFDGSRYPVDKHHQIGRHQPHATRCATVLSPSFCNQGCSQIAYTCHNSNRERSVSYVLFIPLFCLDVILFVSLQKMQKKPSCRHPERAHCSRDLDLIAVASSDFIAVAGSNLIAIASRDLIAVAGRNLIAVACRELIAIAGRDLITIAYSDLIVIVGSDLIAVAGRDLIEVLSSFSGPCQSHLSPACITSPTGTTTTMFDVGPTFASLHPLMCCLLP